MFDLLIFVLGVVMLLDGATVFVRAAINVTEKLKLPRAATASIILALGTSLPELVIAISAVFKGEAGLALGNILGSNIANIFLVLPIAMLAVGVFRAGSEQLRDNAHLLILSSLIFIMLINQGYRPIYGWLSLGVAGMLIYYQTTKRVPTREITAQKREYPNLFIVLMGLMGLAAIIVGAQVLTDSAHKIALALNVSDFFIGLLLLAVSTSLPELATSVAAIKQKEFKIAVGNLVNSNLFNIALVGGAGGLAGTFMASQSFFTTVMFVLSGVAAFALLRFYNRKHVPRIVSYGLLGLYLVYVLHTVAQAG